MMTKDRITLDTILQHKEHFDHRLVGIVEHLEHRNTHLDEEVKRLSTANRKLSKKNQGLQLKVDDLKAVGYGLERKLKEKDEEIGAIISGFEKEIREQGKTIKGELSRSYKENNRLHDENEKLRKKIERLRKENERYKKMNKKNSANSSIPPSRDEFAKVVANSREKTGMKKGGQKGHGVHRIALKGTANKVIYKVVKAAPAGAEAVLNGENEILYYRTQEINAALKTTTTETRYIVIRDGAALPEKEMGRYRISSVSYHDDLRAMVLYLNSRGTLPLARLCTIINEMSMGEISLSASAIVNWGREFNRKSEPYRKVLLETLKKEHVLHVDETGWKVSGKRAWLHVVAGVHGAYFVVTEKRKDTENGPLALLGDYGGCLIHDHYKAYYDLPCAHGECNAHILRYLKEGEELDKNKACGEMIKLIRSMIHEKKELAKKGIMEMDVEQIQAYEQKYLETLNAELERYAAENPKKVAAKYVPQHIKLMRRMVEYREEHLRFIKDFGVPSDNNLAERQMRPTKAKKKISGQSLSLETANNFAAIHTIVQTCSLQGKNTLEEIKAILQS